MSPRAVGILIVVALALSGIGATWLFYIQNSARRVMLSLNLGVTKLALAEPMQVPLLMAICLGVGFVLGAGLVGFARLGRRRRDSLPPSYEPAPYDSSNADRGY